MVARGPSLTFFFIGLLVFVGVMLLIYQPQLGLYDGFLTANNVTPDNAYTNTFIGNLTNAQNDLNGMSNSFQNKGGKSVVQLGLNVVSGIYSTLAIGFGAIGTLVSLPEFATAIFTSMTSMLFIPTAIVSIVVAIIGIFLISKFIKALRGQIDDV